MLGYVFEIALSVLGGLIIYFIARNGMTAAVGASPVVVGVAVGCALLWRFWSDRWASNVAPEDNDSDSGPTHTVIEIPGSTETLVLLDHTREPHIFDNLARLRRNGSERWSAPPPRQSPPDHWIDASLDGEEVVARSWSGLIVRLDLDSGEERSRESTT